MAKNWTAAEAINVLHEGTDTAAIRDIMTRFPSFAFLAIKANDASADMFGFMPDWMTARKMDSWIKNVGKAGKDDEDEAEGDEDEDEDEKPAKKSKKAKADEKPAKKSKKAKEDEDEDDDEDEDEDDEKPAKKPAKKSKKAKEDEDFNFE